MRRTSDGPVWERPRGVENRREDRSGSPHVSHRRYMRPELSAEPAGFAQVPHRWAGERSPGLLDAGRQVLHDVEGLTILADEPGDAVHAVHDGGVVAAAELRADLGERLVGQLAAEVHGDVT